MAGLPRVTIVCFLVIINSNTWLNSVWLLQSSHKKRWLNSRGGARLGTFHPEACHIILRQTDNSVSKASHIWQETTSTYPPDVVLKVFKYKEKNNTESVKRRYIRLASSTAPSAGSNTSKFGFARTKTGTAWLSSSSHMTAVLPNRNNTSKKLVVVHFCFLFSSIK